MELKNLREILALLRVSVSLILNAWDSRELRESRQVCYISILQNNVHLGISNKFLQIENWIYFS